MSVMQLPPIKDNHSALTTMSRVLSHQRPESISFYRKEGVMHVYCVRLCLQFLHSWRGTCRKEWEQSEYWYAGKSKRTSSVQLLKPVALASLLLLLFFVWLERFTSLINILVTAYYFTLCLTQQPIARSGNPSVHATCSQTCSRGHLRATLLAERKKQNNGTIWFLGVRLGGDVYTHIFPPFCHLGTNHSSLKVEMLKRDLLHNALSFAGSPSWDTVALPT